MHAYFHYYTSSTVESTYFKGFVHEIGVKTRESANSMDGLIPFVENKICPIGYHQKHIVSSRYDDVITDISSQPGDIMPRNITGKFQVNYYKDSMIRWLVEVDVRNYIWQISELNIVKRFL